MQELLLANWYYLPAILLALGFLVQMYHYLVDFSKLSFMPKNGDKQPNFMEKPPVSIIICARDEGDNLTEFLPKILTQEYPEFEVIVVNDCSNDNTEDVLREYKEIFPNLKSILVKEDDYYKHGKKFALFVGIKGAKHEHLLLTDADCVPDTDFWVSDMMNQYHPGKEIVIGYGPYMKKKGFLNRLIRFDTFQIGLQYLSRALKGKTYMGVGRNLSYHKSLFFKHKGFSKHYHITSGDDDLFINAAATPNNVSVCVEKSSFTHSIPAKRFEQWKDQKFRHLSTSGFYDGKTRFYLSFFHAAPYLFWLSLPFLLFSPLKIAVIVILFIKLSIQFIIFRGAMEKLDEKDLLLWFPVLEILLLFLYPLFYISGKFTKPNKWKN